MSNKPKKTTPASDNKPVSKKPGGADEKANKPESLKNLPPADLPLSDTWYHFSDLMEMFKVSRSTIDRYIKLGILLTHKWGGTLRFNKTYVDWMIQNGNRNFSWIIALLSSAV